MKQCVSSSHKLDRKFISSVVCNNNFLCTTIIILKQLGSFKGVKHKSNQHHSDLERKKNANIEQRTIHCLVHRAEWTDYRDILSTATATVSTGLGARDKSKSFQNSV